MTLPPPVHSSHPIAHLSHTGQDLSLLNDNGVSTQQSDALTRELDATALIAQNATPRDASTVMQHSTPMRHSAPHNQSTTTKHPQSAPLSLNALCLNTFSLLYKYYEKYLDSWFRLPPPDAPHQDMNSLAAPPSVIPKDSAQQKQQTLAKWFESTSYFETQRHLAYINQQKYHKFQQKVIEGHLRGMNLETELVPVIAFIVRRRHDASFQDKLRHTKLTQQQELSDQDASALDNQLQKIFPSRKDYLQLRHQFFLWMLEELMRRCTEQLKRRGMSDLFSPNATRESTHFFETTLSLLLNAKEEYQSLWRQRYAKHVLLLCTHSVYRKVQMHTRGRRDSNEMQDSAASTFHSLASSLFTHSHNEEEMNLLKPMIGNHAHTNVMSAFFRTLIGYLIADHHSASIDTDLLLCLTQMLKQLPELSSIIMPVVLSKWTQFSEMDEIARLVQESIPSLELEQNEDTDAVIRNNVLLALLLDNVEYLGECTFPLLLKLDTMRSELADIVFFLLVEQMQIMALQSVSVSTVETAAQYQETLGGKHTRSDGTQSTFVGLHLDHHINQIMLRLDQDEKWLYLLEVVGITAGESVAINILSSLFETHQLDLSDERVDQFFDLLCAFEKVYAHIGHTFVEHLLWILSVQSKHFTDATLCLITNLHVFVRHLPTRLPHMKQALFKDLLKHWRYLYGMILLPIPTLYLDCRTTLFHILEMLLMDNSVTLQNYLSTDIVNGLLALFFFLLEPGARKVWTEWTEAEDRASVLYYEYFCHRDPNTLQYRAFIAKLICRLWEQYEVWDETFGYFFELLCSRQIESRLQTSTMMSSEIFEQTNFPLHYHRDMLSVLNSYFPATYPKLSLTRNISESEKLRIMQEDDSLAKRKPSETETASNLFDKLNRAVREEPHPLFTRESVSISKQHPSKLTQHSEVVERNANEIVALISRSCFYTSVHRDKKILSFASHLVSFTKRHNVPNRDQYAKMLPKKSTFDFDMYIGKIFTKFPIFYQFLCLISTDPESFLRFVDVMCSLWVNLIGEWHSTIYFEKYNNTNRDLLIERTKLYMYCLKTAQWIPAPMIFLDEMIHVLSASEITEALCKIWEYITSHIPHLDQFEDRGGSTPIKIRRESNGKENEEFTDFLRKTLENHVEDECVVERHFGRLYRYLYSQEDAEQSMDVMKDEVQRGT